MTERIVVGVDGSETSKEALRWAVHEAALRGAELIALHAWTIPTGVVPYDGIASDSIDWEGNAHETLDGTVKAAEGATEVLIQKRLVQRPAAQALIRASGDADLLVIGSRGYGGFRGLLLGSVGHQCAQHAACPVVIVRHSESTP